MNNSLNLMRSRLEVRGGAFQQDRMIKDKRETLDRIVLYSYRLGKRWFSTFGLSLNNCSIETPRVSAI